MPPIQLMTYAFRSGFGPELSQADRDRSRRMLLAILNTLAAIDKEWLTQYPKTPKLYNSGVRYHHDDGVEYWYDIPTSIEKGYGDCKVFCGWRVAELRRQGVKAAPFITWRQLPNGGWMYHCLVWRPHATMMIDPPPFLKVPSGDVLRPSSVPGDTGYIEDPSRALGMGWEAEFATTNQRPATPEFKKRLAEIMGRPVMPVFPMNQRLAS
jgi:hypothetical protein